MTATRPQIIARPPRTRSAISNGSLLPRDIDKRSATARRFVDLILAFTEDLGGEAALSQAERALIRQAAASVVASEKMQHSIIRGDDIDFEQLTRVSNVSARLLQRLGIKRRTKEPAPGQRWAAKVEAEKAARARAAR
ncbi:hypothetical protein ACMDCR_25840 [Labrys okinawensis]|uniref:hypothetical protein n=1 Tax=Labrys okinawensis TaxID=346911 RepID=UPI0039BCFBCD